jgi:uncharacterized membrane protein YeaQ/YmgE (transglycosylase-associated protein family)
MLHPGGKELVMTLGAFLALLVVAGVCGALGQAIAGYSRTGCLGSIALGFVGALIGMAIARALHLPAIFSVTVGGESFPVIWSVGGSALFVAVLSFFTKRARRGR